MNDDEGPQNDIGAQLAKCLGKYIAEALEEPSAFQANMHLVTALTIRALHRWDQALTAAADKKQLDLDAHLRGGEGHAKLAREYEKLVRLAARLDGRDSPPSRFGR